jgi:prevent-host-death family protein
MEIANIHEAKSQLSRLIERAMNGEEVIIAKSGQPMVRLVPIHADESPRVGGQWKGRVRIADNFDTLPDDIAAAFGIEPAPA